MDDQHDEDVQQADADHAPLTMVSAVILDEDQGPGKDLLRIGDIKPVLAQVGPAFRLAQVKRMSMIIHMPMRIGSD